jgi:hypothetical protein
MDHNTDGRAATIWRLRARQTTAHCVLQELSVGALLTLFQDDEVISREAFPDVHLAEARADALHARLVAKGWKAVPVERPESGRRRA